MKKILVVVVAVAFVLALAVPAFAQSMTHNVRYKMDGDIKLTSQAGHLCNTGAQWNQKIDGEGVMTKVKSVAMVKGKLTVSDKNDWVTAEDASRNLTVTSAIKLCAPPKAEVDGDQFGEFMALDADALIADGVDLGNISIAPCHLGTHPESANIHSALAALQENPNLFVQVRDGEGNWIWVPLARYAEVGNYAFEDGDVVHPVTPYLYPDLDLNKLTKQVWAVQVEADPGFSGNLHQDFEAAYGPYGGWAIDPHTTVHDLDRGQLPLVDGEEQDIPGWGDDFWFWQQDKDGLWSVVAGDDYVGNYFHINQMARTSQGTTRRFIDISSPWSGAFLHEDMTVVGMTEIEETFEMNNLEPGEKAIKDWWDIF